MFLHCPSRGGRLGWPTAVYRATYTLIMASVQTKVMLVQPAAKADRELGVVRDRRVSERTD